jgi:membrane protease YdiL (CAAX protease family)
VSLTNDLPRFEKEDEMNLRATIRHYPVAAFVICALALSFAATFAPVGEADKFYILAALIVPIPMIVAIALASVTGGIRYFIRETLNRRVEWRWTLIAFGVALAARLFVSVIALLTGAISSIEVGTAVPALVVVTYLFALLEEIGWRGFAIRRLVTYRSPFVALLITGIPWSIIHIFFYLAQGADVTTVAQVFVVNFALTVMATWVYLRSGYNIWAAVILHGSQTIFSVFTINIAPDLFNQYWLISYSLIALAILAADWRMWFAHPAVNTAGEAIPSAA